MCAKKKLLRNDYADNVNVPCMRFPNLNAWNNLKRIDVPLKATTKPSLNKYQYEYASGSLRGWNSWLCLTSTGGQGSSRDKNIPSYRFQCHLVVIATVCALYWTNCSGMRFGHPRATAFGEGMNPSVPCYGRIIDQTEFKHSNWVLHSNKRYSAQKLTLCHTLIVWVVADKYILWHVCTYPFRRRSWCYGYRRRELDTATRVQIPDETVYISHS